MLRIGWTAWADAEWFTRLARRVLEERLDQPVELVMADIGLQYQGLAEGDLDCMLMAWLPVTHAEYYARVAGRVVDLGPITTRARLGWAVPAYVPEQELASLEDLREPDVGRRIGGSVQGIDPGAGLMRASERALRAYGLGELTLVSSSAAAMTAAVGRAVDRGEWIVVTAWSPHWMFARWRLRYLEDPRGALGRFERVHALVRPGFDRDFPPRVLEFLARLFVPIDEVEEALLVASERSIPAAVDAWLAAHPERVARWLDASP